MHVDGTLVAVKGVTLYAFEQIKAGEGASRGRHQCGQQVEFGRGQIDAPFVDGNPAPNPIERDFGHAQHLRFLLRLSRAANNSPYPCRQFAHAEWLGDVIIRAQFQSYNFVIFLQFGGQDDNGCVVFPVMYTYEIIATHFGHHQVQQDHVRFFVPRHEKGLLSIAGGYDPKALLGQIGTNQITQPFFVVNYQNRFCHYHLTTTMHYPCILTSHLSIRQVLPFAIDMIAQHC